MKQADADIIALLGQVRDNGSGGGGGGGSTDWGDIGGILADQSDLNTALAGKQPIDSDLTAIAALTTTAFGRALLALADAAALRTAGGLVLGTDIYSKAAIDAGFQPLDSDLTAIAALTTTSFGRAVLALADAAALQTAAGLVIGTNVEAHDADLTTIAGLSPTNDDVLQRKAGAWINRTIAQLIADLAALGTTFQPLDSDLTSIAALTTTSNGRSLLTAAALTAAGLGLTNGATIDGWGAKTVPSGTVVGTTDSQDLTSKHIVEGVITATGTNLGTNITSATASGTDAKGKIAIVVGGTGPTSGAVCRITFGRAWANTPVAVLLTSLDAATGTSQASAKGLYAGNITTTTFDLMAASSGITGNLMLGYIVVGQ